MSKVLSSTPLEQSGGDDGQRNAIFISHANPEDNAFVLWLGPKLAAIGYEVWADVMRLRPGGDWERKLEDALRNRSQKVLFVGTHAGATKPGTRTELQIASIIARRISDESFIIPLHLEDHDPPFSITRAHYIDFSAGWAAGLKQLVESLEADGVHRGPSASNAIWREIRLAGGRALERRPERLISNLLELTLPKSVKYFDFVGPINIDKTHGIIRTAPFGAVPHLRGFFTFADTATAQEHFTGTEVKLVESLATKDFLDRGWSRFGIQRWIASNYCVDILRQAIETTLRSRGLSAYRMASGQNAWWLNADAVPASKLTFSWGELNGRRQLRGYSDANHVHWHYGISTVVRMSPAPRVTLVSRVVFSEDGVTPLADHARAHRLRRSFAKSWRNAKWRDLMLTFIYWLGDGGDIILATGSEENATLHVPPLTFDAQWSVPETEEELNTDDIEIEDDALAEDDGDFFEEDDLDD